MTSRAIRDEPDRFALRREPDGIYRVDGRVIPIRDDGSNVIFCYNDGELVVAVHTVPHPQSDLAIGTLKSIERQSGLKLL